MNLQEWPRDSNELMLRLKFWWSHTTWLFL